MNYQIYDNGDDIKFVGTGGEVLSLMKSSIKEITVVREDVVKIGLGCCLSNIYFRHVDVSMPGTPSATDLVILISNWISGIGPEPI